MALRTTTLVHAIDGDDDDDDDIAHNYIVLVTSYSQIICNTWNKHVTVNRYLHGMNPI